jgi:hypothetical protein
LAARFFSFLFDLKTQEKKMLLKNDIIALIFEKSNNLLSQTRQSNHLNSITIKIIEKLKKLKIDK